MLVQKTLYLCIFCQILQLFLKIIDRRQGQVGSAPTRIHEKEYFLQDEYPFGVLILSHRASDCFDKYQFGFPVINFALAGQLVDETFSVTFNDQSSPT